MRQARVVDVVDIVVEGNVIEDRLRTPRNLIQAIVRRPVARGRPRQTAEGRAVAPALVARAGRLPDVCLPARRIRSYPEGQEKARRAQHPCQRRMEAHHFALEGLV